MIKIVVAEDQPLILKDLCRKIEAWDRNVMIVGRATDGKTAYELVARTRPHILFTDIRMPLMTGLDLIGRLKTEGLEVYSVIISGFKDFEYAREAMKLGVDEYLLKPISADDIAYVLEELRTKLSMKQQDYTQQLIGSLLKSPACRMAHINTVLPYQYYRILLITAGSYPTFTLDYATPHEDIAPLLPLDSLCSRFLGEDEACYRYGGNHPGEHICILCLNTADGEAFSHIARGLVSSACSLPFPLTVCCSRQIRHIDSIGMEVRIMRSYTEMNLIFGKSSLLEVRPLEIRNPDLGEFISPEVQKQLGGMARSFDEPGLQAGLLNLLDQMERSGATQFTIDCCLKKLLKECFPAQTEGSFYMEIDEYLTSSRTYGELSAYLQFSIHQMMKEAARDPSQSDTGLLVKNIQEYIDKNAAKNINIQEIADVFALNPAYLSRIFKKHTGKRPIEYLTAVRIRRACDYFAHTEFSVRQVSELCGYSDQFYFSKAFKSLTGKSPTEYRITVK